MGSHQGELPRGVAEGIPQDRSTCAGPGNGSEACRLVGAMDAVLSSGSMSAKEGKPEVAEEHRQACDAGDGGKAMQCCCRRRLCPPPKHRQKDLDVRQRSSSHARPRGRGWPPAQKTGEGAQTEEIDG